MTTQRFRIKTLNAISPRGLSLLPSDRYEVGSDVEEPHALLVRSANLHSMEFPASVLAVARAGAGTNNIPVQRLSERGIPVFNTPGANANAVKELVFAGALMFARNLFHAALYVRDLPGEGEEMEQLVEAGKKKYVGFELPGRTLGVIGLGSIGVEVANAALGLGMKVIGYDPALSVRHAWQLDSRVQQAETMDEVFTSSDMVTLHVPLIESTRGLVSTQRIAMMPPDSVLLNFARGGIVDEAAVIEALDAGHLRGYICDFPSRAINQHPRVIALPHLGASTGEAEEQCAIMAVSELRSFLEHGDITNSVNFPSAKLIRKLDSTRLYLANRNVPNVVGEVSSALGGAGLNIIDLLNRSRGELAVTVADVEGEVTGEVLAAISANPNILTARII